MAGWYVTANDIKNWTETQKRRAEDILPLLIKKLIYASCKPKYIDFPSGDSVAIGGWDGILEVEEGIEFIPAGISGWEFGTNNDVKGKADKDYEKRLSSPEPFILEETTYVFVTSRLWTKRDEWSRTRKLENKWKDVRGINAETLQNWLEKCPAVHRWFAKIIGKRSADLWDIEQAWNELSSSTSINLTTDFFLHERNEEIKKLKKILDSAEELYRIKSKSKIESYGFLLSVIMEDENLRSRSLIVQNQKNWDLMASSDYELILIPKGFTPNGIGAAISKGHTVVIAVDDMDPNDASIILPTQQRLIRQEAIKELGFNNEKASQLYQDTKGYIEPILRHKLMKPIDYKEPKWRRSVSSDILFAIFFGTEWNEDNDKDKQVMECLSNLPYLEFSNAINELSKENDPPIRRIGNTWQIISKFDLWLMIAPLITNVHLDRLGRVMETVIQDIDPSYDLPSEKRYMSIIEGAVPQYSKKIKRGLVDTLAILSVYGEEYTTQLGGEKPSILVSYWIKQIFKQNNNARFWYSIRDITTLIAEAAPDAFLDAVEKGSVGDESALLGLFKSEGDTIFGNCNHSGLLWGLEIISWNKQYLARVSKCLARLSEIDPGGRWSNRPFNSLVDIYLGWLNNTSATHDERLQVIQKVIVPQYPIIAWRLMTSLLLNKNTTSSGVRKPQYREWCNKIERSPTNIEYYKYVEGIVNTMLEEVEKNNYERICDLIDNFHSYTKDQQNIVIEKLLQINKDEIYYENRKEILKILRNTLAKHREFPDSDWSWPEKLLNQLEDVYNYLQFDDVIERNVFLFNENMPDLVDSLNKKEFDYREREELILQKRLTAFCSIYQENGIEGVKELLNKCLMPNLVGSIAYMSSLSEVMQPLAINWLEEEDNLKKQEFSNGYLTTLATQNFENGNILFTSNKDWGLQKKVKMLLCMPLNSTTLKLVDELPDNGKSLFWTRLNHYRMEENILPHVAEQLFKYDRPIAALEVFANLIYKREDISYLNPILLAEILIKIATDPKDIEKIPIQNVQHDIYEAIKFLQDSVEIPEQVIQQIEWLYLGMVRYNDFSPRYLIKNITKDPAFFTQLIIWVFKRNDESKDPKEDLPVDVVKQRAELSWELLDSVSVLPGQNGNEIDSELLNQWVYHSREILKKVDRQSTGDSLIGKFLSRSPVGKDGIWPHESVREVIERVNSDEIDEGIKIGVLNSRGVTSRQVYAGGEQERILAREYYDKAEVIQLISPRTASILHSIAKSYESYADRQDMLVELES